MKRQALPVSILALAAIQLAAPTEGAAQTAPFAAKLIGSNSQYIVPAGFHVRIDVATADRANPSQQKFDLIAPTGAITHPYFLRNYNPSDTTTTEYYTQSFEKPIFVAAGWRIRFPITAGSSAQLSLFGLLIPTNQLFASRPAQKPEGLALVAGAAAGTLDLKVDPAPTVASVVTTESSTDLKTWGVEGQQLVGPSATPSTLASVPVGANPQKFYRSTSKPADRRQ